MRTRYASLFSIECRHDYFSNGRCTPLALRPTPACQRLLERYRCLFRATAAGGMVAFPSEEGADFQALYEEAGPLSFDLVSDDPYLLNYTDGEPAEGLYYFNNLGDAPDAADLLHPPGQALAAGPLPVVAKRFRHRLDQPIGNACLSVVDSLNDAPVWQNPACAPETRDCALDLSALADGRYRLLLDGRELRVFYLSDQPAATRWGVVDIYPGGPGMPGRVPPMRQVVDDSGRPLPKSFAIRMTTRSTLWRYYIVNPNTEDRRYEGHRVEGVARRQAKHAERPAAPFAFEEMGQTQVDGREARVFESTQPIPLREHPGVEYEFTFRANGQGERGGRALKLPYARAQASRLETLDGARRMVSEIYVYL